MPSLITQLQRQLCWVGGVAGLLLLTSCGPSLYSYYYISLEEVPEAHIVERTQATPGEYRFFVGEIPTRYEIKREGYTLILMVHTTTSEPLVAVSIHSDLKRTIGFHHPSDRVPGACVKWEHSEPSIWWTYSFHHCGGTKPWQKIDNHLRFTVFDQDGAAVAEEAIPYRVIRDGFYGHFDAI